jgi:hypothetical protein
MVTLIRVCGSMHADIGMTECLLLQQPAAWRLLAVDFLNVSTMSLLLLLLLLFFFFFFCM